MIVYFVQNYSSFYSNVTYLLQDTAKNQLDDLGPILEPEPIKFSFDSPGWYIIGLIILILIFLAAIRLVKNYKANYYRRAAIKSLEQLDFNNNQSPASQVLNLLVILKQVALHAYGRKEVAALYGSSWLQFLESKGKNTSFSKFQPLINKATYEGKQMDLNDLNELKNLSKKWIRSHA